MFSLLSLSFTLPPSNILEARDMPWYAKSMDFSILTRPLSNTKAGSAISTVERANATKFRALTTYSVFVAPVPLIDSRNPRSKPMSQPVSVKPSRFGY
jgi:hypothetical protein